MCVCVFSVQHLQSDTPPCQSQSRQDVFLSSLSDVCQGLKSSGQAEHVLSHSKQTWLLQGFLMGSGGFLWGLKNLWFKCSSGADNSSSDVNSFLWPSDVLNWYNHSHALKFSFPMAPLQQSNTGSNCLYCFKGEGSYRREEEKETGRQISGIF